MNILSTYNDFVLLVLVLSTLSAICAVSFLSFERGKPWQLWLALSVLLTPAVSLIFLVLQQRENPAASEKDSTMDQTRSQNDDLDSSAASDFAQDELNNARAESEAARQKRLAAEKDRKEQSRILAQIQLEKELASIELLQRQKIKKQTSELLQSTKQAKDGGNKINDRLNHELEELERLQDELNQEREKRDDVQKRNKQLRQEIEQKKQEELRQLKKSRLKGQPDQFSIKGLRWN